MTIFGSFGKVVIMNGESNTLMASTSKTLYGFEARDVDNRGNGRESKVYDIKKLWQRSHEILGMALRGMKNVEIAQVLNITPQTVSNTLNSSLGREKLSYMRYKRDKEFMEIDEKITALAHQSLDVYNEILERDGVELGLKKDTADTILLELKGLRAPAKTESANITMYATPEEIADFKKRGIEAAKASGKLIDIPEGGDGNE